jgi:far upstream element-binding protein
MADVKFLTRLLFSDSLGIHPDRKRQLETADIESSYSKIRPGLGSSERRTMDYGNALAGTTTSPSMKTEEMFVPREVVGLVIGRGGDTLKRIQSESHAKIQVDQENRDAPQRRVTIMASSQEDIQKAKALIEEIMSPPQRSVGRQTIQMGVPGRVVGSIIGRGGESIRELQEKSGAKIQIDPNAEPLRGERMINITGDSQAIDRAKQLIQDILTNVSYSISTR